MKNRLWGKRVLAVMATATLALPLIAGCTASENTDNEQRVLRVATLWGGQDDSYFRQQFTDAFELTHKNVTVEIVPAINQSMYGFGNPEEQEAPDTMESLKKIMTGDNPVDVVVADTSTIKSLIQENMVKQLDPLMQEDKFDTSDIVPSVLEGIKDLGDQNIYALTPTFSSSALFYNKGMFQKAGVEPPTDNMTWDDIFNLATRLTKGEGKDHVFGMAFTTYQGGSPYYSMQQYYNSLQLKVFDDKAEKMTVDSPQWEKVWSTVSKLAIDKVIPKGDEPQDQDQNSNGRYNPFQGDLFMTGKTAMAIGDYNYINQLIEANNNADKMKDFTKIEWDVVTPPVHPEAPEIGGNIYLSSLMAINSSAQNPDDAWELIKYMNSEDWAKIKARSSYELVSRKSFIKPKDGLDYNIQAFYTLKPVPPTNTNLDKLYQKMPSLYQVSDKGMEYFNQVLENKKTPKEALGEWAAKGNEMLAKLKKDPKATFQ